MNGGEKNEDFLMGRRKVKNRGRKGEKKKASNTTLIHLDAS